MAQEHTPQTGFESDGEDPRDARGAALTALDPRTREDYVPPEAIEGEHGQTQVGVIDDDTAQIMGLGSRADRDEARDQRLREERSFGGGGITAGHGRPEPEPDMALADAETELESMLSVEPVPVDEITEDIDMPMFAKRLSKKRVQQGLPPLPVDKDGVAHFIVKVRALHESELEGIGRRAEREPTREQKEQGVRGKVRDMNRFQRLVFTESIMTPNLADPRLLKRDGPTPEHVVSRWFLQGEIDNAADVVTDISGWSAEAVKRVGKS